MGEEKPQGFLARIGLPADRPVRVLRRSLLFFMAASVMFLVLIQLGANGNPVVSGFETLNWIAFAICVVLGAREFRLLLVARRS